MELYPSNAAESAYNVNNRNSLKLGFNPQPELGSDRLATIAF
ncbi:hypothetical protein [Nostoc sp. ChiQUE01b]|nr:hypothetical protein [Nostoc sp. ChiQUE01b]MDZ8260847.1 hypothetical protein [Nostoc sp. ChiQUE01b]